MLQTMKQISRVLIVILGLQPAIIASFNFKHVVKHPRFMIINTQFQNIEHKLSWDYLYNRRSSQIRQYSNAQENKDELNYEQDTISENVISKNRSLRKGKIQKSTNIKWLEQATKLLCSNQPGTLIDGKWHQVVSLFNAWSSLSKRHESAPVYMETLLKMLVEERNAGNNDVEITIELYNSLLDAWACAALFKMTIPQERASQRVREILVVLQENHERGDLLSPNKISFNIVFHCACRIEGALVARRLLAWMEYLIKSGKNIAAKPIRSDYIMILDTYAKYNGKNVATLTEGFIRHMNSEEVRDTVGLSEFKLPDTYCYNILLKAWNKQVGMNKRQGRDAAEQADRILEEMKERDLDYCRPDLITYASK